MRMYESVTRSIIEEMERGAVPWVRPWKTNRYSKTNVMPAIVGELRHAGYIENWLDLLRHDNRAIFTAPSKASQAADFLRSFSESRASAEEEA